MGKPKDAIWEKFEVCYRQGDARSMYCKCSACNEPMIAAVGRMHDHYIGCKKQPRSIGQLDAGGGSNGMHEACISKGIDDMHDEDIFEAEEVMDENNIYEWGGLSVV